jgi:hypothetical protein
MAQIRTRMLSSLTRLETRLHGERGDIPGWVLVTLMTAGIVAVIWGLAQDQLRQILQQALENVAPNN